MVTGMGNNSNFFRSLTMAVWDSMHTMAMAQEQKPTFEEGVRALEQVVRELEGGKLTLDESLVAFEKGIALSRECEKLLEAAKGRVEQLITLESGEVKTVPFEAKENGSEV